MWLLYFCLRQSSGLVQEIARARQQIQKSLNTDVSRTGAYCGMLECNDVDHRTLRMKSLPPSVVTLKGHNTQHSGHMGKKKFKLKKTKEIQLVRPTEVCGKKKY